jgi:hypothetical protein
MKSFRGPSGLTATHPAGDRQSRHLTGLDPSVPVGQPPASSDRGSPNFVLGKRAQSVFVFQGGVAAADFRKRHRAARAPTTPLRPIISGDSMKNATATSRGNIFLLESCQVRSGFVEWEA